MKVLKETTRNLDKQKDNITSERIRVKESKCEN